MPPTHCSAALDPAAAMAHGRPTHLPILRPRRARRSRWLLSALLFAAMAPVAQAQVQRQFVNLGFEDPALVTPGCRVYIAASQVPGWNTTHPAYATQNVGGCVVPAGFNQTAPILELWRTPRDNASGGTVNARSGVQIAELNAEVASRIYQNVCLVAGEPVNWRFSHRGRGSATVHDQMELRVGASNTVVRVGTTNTGAFLAPVVSQGTAQTPVNVAGNTSWVDYRGSFNYAGATGVTNLGFEAIGGSTSGNLLDDIQIELAPFVEFIAPSSSTPESATQNVPTVRVNGTVYTAFTITARITGGTATIGADYTTPGNSTTLTISVPAGNYDGVSSASLFPLPITIVNDTIGEPNETIELQLPAPAGATPAYRLASNSTCGGSAQTTWTYTIVDDDARISVVKNAAAPVAVAGQPTQFDVVYTIVVANPSGQSASYTLSDTPGLDADASIVSAGSTRSGGGSGGGAATRTFSGSGPWALTTGNRSLPAGQSDTYALTVRIQVNRGGSSANDTCSVPSSAGSGLHNSVTATLQSPAATFGDSACQNTPTPVWVTLNKRLDARANATDQAQVRLFSGGILAQSATTSGSGLPATASTGLQVLPAGNTLQFAETIKANGTGADTAPDAYLVQMTCTNANAGSTTVLPSGAGATVGATRQWPEFSPAAGDDISCTIANSLPEADLSITKDNGASAVIGGGTTTYTVVVSNAGPAPANGAILRDPAPAGMTCTTVTCSGATGGAACPAATIGGLQGGGVALPTLPAASSLTFQIGCSVN